MKPGKRIEIITGATEVDRIEEILKEFAIPGYVIHSDAVGKGNRLVASPNALTGEFEVRLITTTCSPERAGRLLEYLEAFVKRYGGACVGYDAQCAVP